MHHPVARHFLDSFSTSDVDMSNVITVSAVAVADAYNISVSDLLHLDSTCFKNVFWDYFTSIAHL